MQTGRQTGVVKECKVENDLVSLVGSGSRQTSRSTYRGQNFMYRGISQKRCRDYSVTPLGFTIQVVSPSPTMPSTSRPMACCRTMRPRRWTSPPTCSRR